MKLLLFALLATAESLCAQTEFAPVGAEWYYRYIFSWTGTDAYAHAVCEKDTVIQGQHCKQVCLSRVVREQQDEICNETLYYYQSGDSIFQFTPGEVPTAELIFRNDLKVGEIFYTSFGRSYKVTNIDSVTYNGRLTRWFELSDTFNILNAKRYISDLFGPELGFFDPYMGNIADDNEYYLRCYSDPIFPLISLTTDDCQTVHVPSPPLYKVSIAPNPVFDKLYLYFAGALPSALLQFTVWDAMGRLVLTENKTAGTRELDVQSLSSGFYILVVQSGTTTVQQKFVKN